MGYALGIDLGTTYSAAAISRDGNAQIVHLGARAATIPSTVLLREDGALLSGEPAERRAASEPGRTGREFKRRLGDPTPILLGSTPFGAEALMARLLHDIVEQVSTQEGSPPDSLVVTHPASYGPYKLDLMREMARLADVGEVRFLAEPQAAALHYAAQERIEAGTVVAVYDFGGGTFDAAILRKTEDGFELLGQPDGMERLGGIDFDEAIFQHVLRALGDAAKQLDPGDPTTTAAVARLREECRTAKEHLSSDTDATISVMLPSIQTEVRLTREEFEEMVRPRVHETVAALERAVRSTGLELEAVDRILLAGGTSRIPMIGQLLREQTGRSVAVDTHPKHAIALGAAEWAAANATAPAEPAAEAAAKPAVIAEAAETVAEGEARTASSSSANGLDLPETAVTAEAEPVPVAEPNAEATAPPVARASKLPAAGDAPPVPPMTDERAAAASGGGLPKVLLFGIPGAVIAAAVAGFLVLGGGSEDVAPVATVEPTEAATVEPTEVASVEPTTVVPPPQLSVALSSAAIEGRQYVVDFEPTDFDPGAGDEHLHFYWGNLDDSEAGLPGGGPWEVHQTAEPFTSFAVNERPSDARDICATVVNADHTLREGSSSCIALPEPLVPPGVDYALMTDIALAGDGSYAVSFETFEFDPAVPGQHVHFFFDTVPVSEAGVPGEGPWTIYGGDSPFTLLGSANRPAGAEQLCMLVANADHSIRMESGNCVDLP